MQCIHPDISYLVTPIVDSIWRSHSTYTQLTEYCQLNYCFNIVTVIHDDTGCGTAVFWKKLQAKTLKLSMHWAKWASHLYILSYIDTIVFCPLYMYIQYGLI